MTTGQPDIDAVELLGANASADGRSLRVRVRDRSGRVVSVALPSAWLDAMVTALPWPPPGEAVHALASWSMDRVTEQDLILTLRTPEGHAFTFALKPWQIAGMATIAGYGPAAAPYRGRMH